MLSGTDFITSSWREKSVVSFTYEGFVYQLVEDGNQHIQKF